MTVITESKPIAHELRDIARWFIHRATSEAEPETKQSNTNDAWTCNKAADEIDDLRARVAVFEADENAGSAITAMPIQIGDDLCYLPVNAHGIVKMALMECSAEPVYIPPMIDVSADIHPDEIAGFERGAQSALNYVFNMGPLYTAAKGPHK